MNDMTGLTVIGLFLILVVIALRTLRMKDDQIDPYEGQKWEAFQKRTPSLPLTPEKAEGGTIGGEGGMVKKRGNKAGTSYVEVFKGKDQFYWRLRGGNWEILCHSEGYNRKQAATNTAQKLFNDLSHSPDRAWEYRDLT